MKQLNNVVNNVYHAIYVRVFFFQHVFKLSNKLAISTIRSNAESKYCTKSKGLVTKQVCKIYIFGKSLLERKTKP